jgi:hypothetical protein
LHGPNHHFPEGRPLPLSQRLAQIIAGEGRDRLTFSELARELESTAWGGLLFIFASINVLPLPPGTSAFFALPLLIVSAQMVFGRGSPWFPARLDRRGVTKKELGKLIDKVGWLESRVERIFKPRLPQLTGPTATRLVGLLCFVLALIAAIPVPLFHVAPAVAIVLFGLALIYRDGAVVIAAIIASMLAIAVDAMIVGSGVVALTYIARWFGL